MKRVGGIGKIKEALMLAAWSWSAGLDGTSFGRFCRQSRNKANYVELNGD